MINIDSINMINIDFPVVETMANLMNIKKEDIVNILVTYHLTIWKKKNYLDL